MRGKDRKVGARSLFYKGCSYFPKSSRDENKETKVWAEKKIKGSLGSMPSLQALLSLTAFGAE